MAEINGETTAQAPEAVVAPQPAEQASIHVKKWGPLLISSGYCTVPNIIIQQHRELGLDADDLDILLQLCCFWWTPGEWPHPSLAELAKATGLHVRNVQRRLKKMQGGGFVEIKKRPSRHGDWDSNVYDLSGLIKEATKLAQKEVARRKDAALAKLGRKRSAKGKPPLKVVKG